VRFAVVALVLAGCDHAPTLPFLMHPAAHAGADRDADQAVIVFVHHRDPRAASCAPDLPCRSAPPGWHDGGSPTVRIFDSNGTYVGDSVAGTSFAAHVSPGEHVLAAWTMHWDDQAAMTAMIASVEAGKIYYIDVRSRVYYGPHGKGPPPWQHELELHPLRRAIQIDANELVAGTRWIAADGERAAELVAGNLALFVEIHDAAATATRGLYADDGY
jgi:hypothetical protein